MRLHPRAPRTPSALLPVLLLALLLVAAACADADGTGEFASETPTGTADATAPPDDLTGRWEAVEGTGVLLLRPDGSFTLHHDLGGAPYEGTYAAAENGRVRLDIPDLAPFYVQREGDDLAFYAPGADRVRYERR